jgi:N4-gp56 family major capsid protein
LTQRFAQTDNAKTRSGNTVKWARYHAFSISTAPLAEGVPPSVQPLTKTDYTAVLQQYGAAVELTDVCVDLAEDNPLDIATQRCGEQMAQVIETLTIDVLKSGTNIVYANGATTRATVNSPPLRGDFRLIERGFDRNDGKEITKIIPPTPDVSTRGITPSFIAMAHTDLIPDFKNCTGFVEYITYGAPGQAIEGEIGQISRHRVICSRMFSPWLAAATSSSGSTYLTNGVKGTGYPDVYPIICVARDAYGVVRLQGLNSMEMKVRQPNGQPDSTDVLAQKGSVGWKTYFAAAILNEYWLTRYEAACTAAPV